MTWPTTSLSCVRICARNPCTSAPPTAQAQEAAPARSGGTRVNALGKKGTEKFIEEERIGRGVFSLLRALRVPLAKPEAGAEVVKPE